jgi:hypothetical protein
MGDITDERDAETAALASAMRCVSVTAVEDDGGELDEDEGVCCCVSDEDEGTSVSLRLVS